MVSEDEILGFARKMEGVSEDVLEQNDGQVSKTAVVFRHNEQVFLVVWQETSPLRIEVKCDGKLGKLLREKYESVMLSQTLGGNGIEVICSGQLSEDEVLDLVRHGYGRTAT